jgi:hypothetical protein
MTDTMSFIPPGPLNVPVLFLVFDRPDVTTTVFESIRKSQPARLYVAADGPRLNMPGEAQKCRHVREIATSVDWDCNVFTLFRDKNLGCRIAVSTAIDWFFEHEEDGIILEDDCLPHPTFFRFCEELLEKYRDDERIALIAGTNYQFGRKRTSYSYYFSRYNHIWGWASWRRTWRNYDVDMKLWPEVRNGEWLRDLLGEDVARYWTENFEMAYNGKIDTWDYQWTFACWIHNGLSILPNVNLVSNIGFNPEATHTKDSESKVANLPMEEMGFPLIHPNFMIRDARADDFTHNLVFKQKTFLQKITSVFVK